MKKILLTVYYLYFIAQVVAAQNAGIGTTAPHTSAQSDSTSGVSIAGSIPARTGNSAIISIGGYTNWTDISDGRVKKNIRENVKGLGFIMKLRPVTYQLDIFPICKKLNEVKNAKLQTAIREKEKMVQSGFIAQEVEQVAKELNYDFSGIEKPKNENGLYRLRYAEFVVPLVKAIQEQQVIIEKQQQQIEKQQQQLDAQKKDNEEMKMVIASQEIQVIELLKKTLGLELILVNRKQTVPN